MPLVSPIVSTGAMGDLDVQRGKMAGVLQHLQRCLVSSATLRMFLVLAEQLQNVSQRSTKALPMMF